MPIGTGVDVVTEGISRAPAESTGFWQKIGSSKEHCSIQQPDSSKKGVCYSWFSSPIDPIFPDCSTSRQERQVGKDALPAILIAPTIVHLHDVTLPERRQVIVGFQNPRLMRSRHPWGREGTAYGRGGDEAPPSREEIETHWRMCRGGLRFVGAVFMDRSCQGQWTARRLRQGFGGFPDSDLICRGIVVSPCDGARCATARRGSRRSAKGLRSSCFGTLVGLNGQLSSVGRAADL
jgi:hypothetical protein